MRTGIRKVMAFVVLTTVAAPSARAATDALSDSDLVARALAIFASKESPADRILGVHRGQQVLLEVRCGDVCPAYTVRIIHYLAPADANCVRLGGDVVGIAVPAGIAIMNQDFCIPHVLVARILYTDHPYQK